MSTNAAINTSTGQHAVDPYKTQNYENPPVAQKIEDLVNFISEIKFGMLTTMQSNGELLVSRCMALAGKVYISSIHESSLFSFPPKAN